MITASTTADRSHAQALLDWAAWRVAELEQQWSRFIDTSDVSRINAAAGSAVPVGADTVALVGAALEARELSSGRFDPTLLQAMCANGYDRTFVSLAGPAGLPALNLGHGESGSMQIDHHQRTVRASPGTGFDPGGIGKGLAADMVAQELIERGAVGAMVNVGGDIRCSGTGPAHGVWVIAAGDRVAGVANRCIELTSGAVATSTRRRRTWQRRTTAGIVQEHHLLDPTTGRASKHAADLVTVIADRCADAEWIATSIASEGSLPVDRSFIGGATVLVTNCHGQETTHGDVERYVR